MALYLYMLFNKTTVIAARTFDAADDDDAIKRSMDLRGMPPGCTGFTVWQDGRKIHHYRRPEVDEK